ncbi:MAG: carboxypeptidase-like regulatory domain-containing protein, partial [Prevotella sp.]
MRERLLSTFLMLAVLLTGFATEVGAQQKQKEIRIEFKKAPMSDVLKKLQKTSGYQILFTYDDVKRITVEGPLVAKDINDALRQLFEGRPFAYTVDGKYVSVLLKENVERKQPLQRQKTYKVSGFVMDTQQGTLPGASVAVEGTSIMVVADESGHFSLNLPLGVKSTIVVSYVGMKTARRTFYLLEQMPIDTVSIKQRWEAMLNVSG